MRVLVCGGRDYVDRFAVFSALDSLCMKLKAHEEIVVIEGGAKGAGRPLGARVVARGVQGCHHGRG